MSSDLDKLKLLVGKKVTNIEFEWDDAIDDYSIESITFEDGTIVTLWTKGDCISFFVDKEEKDEKTA